MQTLEMKQTSTALTEETDNSIRQYYYTGYLIRMNATEKNKVGNGQYGVAVSN